MPRVVRRDGQARYRHARHETAVPPVPVVKTAARSPPADARPHTVAAPAAAKDGTTLPPQKTILAELAGGAANTVLTTREELTHAWQGWVDREVPGSTDS